MALKGFEGFSPEAYQCSASVWTIGYGHTRGVKRGDVISREEAEMLLRQDISEAEDVANNTPGIRTQGQFDAVVDFIYNCGARAFRRSTLRKCIIDGASVGRIQAEFAQWVYVDGERLPGLVRRRAWESEQWAKT